MPSPLFITTENRQSTLPLLIVDKLGILSKGLVSVLSEHFTTVLVSQKSSLPHLERIVHIPFRRNIPSIPDNPYSSILIYYHGEKALKDSLHVFIKKAKQNNARLLFITARKHASEPFLQKALADYDHFHVVIYGDIFGISRSEDSLVTHMIHEAHLLKKITIHGTGLTETYPVYYADVLQGMLHMLFSQSPPQVGFLYPSHPVTEIHLARLIKLLYSQADLVFAREGTLAPEPVVSLEGTTLIDDPYPLAEKLKHISIKSISGPMRKYKRGKKLYSAERTYVSFVVFTLLLVIILSFSTLLFFLAGLFSLQSIAQAGKEGDLLLVAKRADTASTMFGAAEGTSGILVLTGRTIGLGKLGDYYLQNIRTGKTVAAIAGYGANAGLTYGPIASGKSLNPKEGMLRISSDIKQALLGLSQLQAENSLPQTYAAQLALYSPSLRKISGIADVLPELTGVGKEQKYLILFQNNMELRPGGGFIGSYGLLTMKDGRMSDFTIHDVYDADGQLTGHIEPPFALKRYIGATHLFMRDSNFDVEFTENAARAASLLQLSMGDQVDGVITMDVSFLKTLLENVGPVYLPAYDETVSAKNFYMAVQSHAEKDFFPGSSQKKDYLQHVARALLLSLQDRERLPYIALFQSVQTALAQKHLMVTSANTQLRTLLSKNGFTPSVQKSTEESAATIDDFAGIFDANVGLNKTNYYIKRAITQTIHISGTGERQESLAVSYTNTSTKDSPFGGDYKNYVRFVVPAGSVVTNLLVNGVSQERSLAVTSERVYTSDRFIPPPGIEIEQESKYGRELLGMYLEVPMGVTKSLTLQYIVPQTSPLPDSFSYLLRVFKQPGTDFDPYQLNMTYDPAFRVIKSPTYANRTDRTIKVQTELSEDILLPLTFSRQ